jgi:hypothetical protein
MCERSLEHTGGGVGVVARVRLDIGVAGAVVDDAVEMIEAHVA